MYGLRTPVCRSLSEPEFDSISSILAHSGIKPDSPWMTSVDSDGNVFYVELEKTLCFENGYHGFQRSNPLSRSLPRRAFEDESNKIPDFILRNENFYSKQSTPSKGKSNNVTSSEFSRKIEDIHGLPLQKNNFDKSNTTEHQLKNGSLAQEDTNSTKVLSSKAKASFNTWSPRIRNGHAHITQVYISINSNFALSDHKKPSSLCERLLGIIPGTLKSECRVESSSKNSFSDNLVTVHGLVPDSSALRCRKIKPGQLLLTVSGCKVTWGCLDRVLTELLDTRHSNKVKLTLRNCVNQETHVNVLRSRNLHSAEILNQKLRGDNNVQDSPSASVMYLTLQDVSYEKSDKLPDDVIYEFSEGRGQIKKLRGVFLTLAHSLKDVTDTDCKSSSLLIDSVLTNVCYHLNGRNLFIISQPAHKQTLKGLQATIEDIVKLIQYMFESLDSAFTDITHHPTLDHLFSTVLQFHRYKGKAARVIPPCISSLYSQAVSLPLLYKARIDIELSNYESADFSEKVEDFGLRRSYTILGTCLFFKGYLLASHLPPSDLTDIRLFLTCHSLLTQSVKQLLLWQEVYPSRRCQDVPRKHVFGYSEPDGRWFLLVVGVGKSLLCVLLEAAGCSSRLEQSPGPDMFYIEQTKACLLQILSSPMERITNLRIQHDPYPTLSADWFYNGKQNNLPTQSSWLKQMNTSSDSGLRLRTNSLDKTASSTSKILPFKRSVSLGHENTASSDKSVTAVVSKDKLMYEGHDHSATWLGKEPSLFQYVYVETKEGVLLAPPSSPQGPIHTDLTENFRGACQSIRSLFKHSTQVQRVLDENKERTFGVDVTFDLVEEHGILFRYNQLKTSKKSHQSLTYWVVGRRFTRGIPRELYVCFPESAPQNMVELAFKLGFGRTLT